MSVTPVQTSTPGAFNGSLTATTTLTGVTAGNHIIVVAMHADTAGTSPDLSCSDSQATYSVDVDASSGGGVARTKLVRLANANAGTHTISVVASSGLAANSKGAIVALEVPPVILDQSATAGGNSTAVSVGPTSALSDTSDLAVAGLLQANMSVGGGTFPPTGGTGTYTSLGVAHSNQCDAAYQTLTSNAAVSANWGTLSTTGKYTAAVAAYKLAALVPPVGQETLSGQTPSVVGATATVLTPLTARERLARFKDRMRQSYLPPRTLVPA